jgi:hypothetical protein
MKQGHCMALLILIPGVASSADTDTALGVRIYDKSGLSSSDLDRATRELRSIYRSAGISVTLQDCRLPDSCSDEFHANEVGFRLLPGTCPTDPGRLAAAFVARGGNLSTIYLAAVRQAADRNGVQIDSVLGYTIAHEIAHLLGLPHSSNGVMKAGWTDSDYRAISGGRMLFTNAEKEAIHRRLEARFAGEKPLQLQPESPDVDNELANTLQQLQCSWMRSTLPRRNTYENAPSRAAAPIYVSA